MATTTAAHPTANTSQWRDRLLLALLLAGAVGVYGHCLQIGFWLDDWNHLELCRENGFANLANGNHFDWTKRIARVWWAREETGWSYFRPLTVAWRTLLLRQFGLNPLPFHLAQLALFLVSLALFFSFLRDMGMSALTAALAGGFLVLNPANVFVVCWLANDGPLFVGLWTLLGLWAMRYSAARNHRSPLFLAAVFGCYALAMASRENGVMLGPLLVLFDVLFTRSPAIPSTPHWRRWAIYCVLVVELAFYLALRHMWLPAGPLPRNPYFHWPWEPGFLAWLPFKALNDMTCLTLGLPFVPIVEVKWWRTHPATALVVGLLALGLIRLVWAWQPNKRLALGLIAGIFLAMAPTALVFSAAYNHYLQSAGWALLLALAATRCRETRARGAIIALSLLGGVYVAGQWSQSWMLHACAWSERIVHEVVLQTAPQSYPPQARLFFLNLPFFAGEVAPAIRLSTDRPDLQVYPLTLAARVFVQREPIQLQQLDAHTLLARTAAPGWFAGAFGEDVQLGWFGARRRDIQAGPYVAHQVAGNLPFQVIVEEANADGITCFRFVFERELSDPSYRFFAGGNFECAVPIAFPGPGQTPVFLPHTLSVPVIRDRLGRMQIAHDIGTKFVLGWPW